MYWKNLRRYLRSLALLEKTSAPVISCYLNLESEMALCRHEFQERAASLRKDLDWHARREFEEAVGMIEKFISVPPRADVRAIAIFARGGARRFFLPIQLRVPVTTWMAADSSPAMYHLVELKDTYHRFVIVLMTEKSVRILEVNLGYATEALVKDRHEAHGRVGPQGAELRYQFRRPKDWILETSQVLDFLMLNGGYKHLFLAGDLDSRMSLRDAMPKRLAAMVTGMIVASDSDQASDVIAATISSFVQHEDMESRAIVEQLQREVVSARGLAVSGSCDTLQALQSSAVDVLVIAQEYEPPQAWWCARCGAVSLEAVQLDRCSMDGGIRILDLKEEMIRLAELHQCTVETVKSSDVLMQLGGVGALLRWKDSDRLFASSVTAGLGRSQAA